MTFFSVSSDQRDHLSSIIFEIEKQYRSRCCKLNPMLLQYALEKIKDGELDECKLFKVWEVFSRDHFSFEEEFEKTFYLPTKNEIIAVPKILTGLKNIISPVFIGDPIDEIRMNSEFAPIKEKMFWRILFVLFKKSKQAEKLWGICMRKDIAYTFSIEKSVENDIGNYQKIKLFWYGDHWHFTSTRYLLMEGD